jgi:hypothetical protein
MKHAPGVICIVHTPKHPKYTGRIVTLGEPCACPPYYSGRRGKTAQWWTFSPGIQFMRQLWDRGPEFALQPIAGPKTDIVIEKEKELCTS